MLTDVCVSRTFPRYLKITINNPGRDPRHFVSTVVWDQQKCSILQTGFERRHSYLAADSREVIAFASQLLIK